MVTNGQRKVAATQLDGTRAPQRVPGPPGPALSHAQILATRSLQLKPDPYACSEQKKSCPFLRVDKYLQQKANAAKGDPGAEGNPNTNGLNQFSQPGTPSRQVRIWGHLAPGTSDLGGWPSSATLASLLGLMPRSKAGPLLPFLSHSQILTPLSPHFQPKLSCSNHHDGKCSQMPVQGKS